RSTYSVLESSGAACPELSLYDMEEHEYAYEVSRARRPAQTSEPEAHEYPARYADPARTPSVGARRSCTAPGPIRVRAQRLAPRSALTRNRFFPLGASS